jgi:hypothetical protein
MKALMAVNIDLARPTLGEFIKRIRHDVVPLNHQFCYFLAGTQFGEEEVREYLSEPVAALPPLLVSRLPKVCLLLVPFLERPNGKNGGRGDVIRFDQPPRNRWAAVSSSIAPDELLLGLSVNNQEVADYHYHLFHEFARLASGGLSHDEWELYKAVLAEELASHAHGEVDETSWEAKQALLRRQSDASKPSQAFDDYARASFIDTLTLYLHGICCDIDVEPGPRQIPSRHLRRRLKLLQSMFPAPSGYAVFPEDMDRLALPPGDD